jgi:hypothetical protein
LCHSEQDARELIGELQAALKNYNLELNESKTTLRTLPEGIFREWRSIYQRLEKLYRPKYTFKKFRDFYLGVLDLDRRFPDTGIIDRFLADLRTKSYTPKFPTSPSDAPKVISLLLLLSERRIKAFPTILGLIEIMKERQDHALYFKMVTNHFTDLIQKLSVKEGTSRYQLSWLIYFMKSNSIPLKKSIIFEDPIVNSIYTSRNKVFPKESDFKLLRSPRTAKKSGPIIQHVDVFRPQ